MFELLATVLLNAVVVLGVANLVPGVTIRGGFGTAVSIAAVYGLLQWGLKTVLVLVTLPMVILTFGLFLLVLNGFLLWLTDKLLDQLEIRGFAPLAIATVGLTVGTSLVRVLVHGLFH